MQYAQGECNVFTLHHSELWQFRQWAKCNNLIAICYWLAYLVARASYLLNVSDACKVKGKVEQKPTQPPFFENSLA